MDKLSATAEENILNLENSLDGSFSNPLYIQLMNLTPKIVENCEIALRFRHSKQEGKS